MGTIKARDGNQEKGCPKQKLFCFCEFHFCEGHAAASVKQHSAGSVLVATCLFQVHVFAVHTRFCFAVSVLSYKYSLFVEIIDSQCKV